MAMHLAGVRTLFRAGRLPALLLLLLLAALPLQAADDTGFEPLFDGKTLEKWDGNPDFWRVEEGAITGETTAEKPTKGNTFIIWRGGEVADFELKLEYRILSGNSGIQYRSFEVPDQKWVVGGYQADLEAGDRFSGINYGEKFRGILAARGQKTVVGANHKPTVVGKLGETAELQKHIKKEDWNEYHIIARGNHFVHKINGQAMSELTDDDVEKRRDSGILALQLHAGPPMKVQFRNIRLKRLGAAAKGGANDATSKSGAGKKKIVFIAGRPSHGYGSHEHNAGCLLLAKHLKKAMPGYECVVYRSGWPAEGVAALEGADAVVVYCDGGGRHLLNPHLEEFDKLMDTGVGLACIHYGVEVPKGPSGEAFLEWIGGYFEPHWSVNPHWDAEFKTFPDHPITRGVKPFKINDEWYYHMRFRPEMQGVTPILSAHPPESTLKRKDGAHSGNPHVRASVARGEIQHLAWASEREGGGRGFGFTGGHFHLNWGDENFRKAALNAIVWIAHGEVPPGGVGTETITRAELEENQDYPKPGDKKPGDKKKGGKKQERKKEAAKGAANTKPAAFRSRQVTRDAPRVDVQADIRGAKELYLVVTDGGDGYACDWADWAEPRLIGPAGEKKLTDLKWKSATSQWGQVRIGKNAGGGALRIAGQSVSYGIGTHANSVIAFDLPAGYEKFVARGGLDNGGTDQGGCGNASSVQFLVFTSRPSLAAARPDNTKGAAAGGREPADAVANLEVHPELTATLFAAEPMLLSPSNIDVDHRGRVWVCEIVNYRRHKGKRPEGDRILILEDSDGDGQADKKKVFYQGSDIDSPHGVCVLGTPDGKNTRVLVSAGSKVISFTDVDGDDRPDRKEDLFTGISGSQHDHGIHAFVFGPDGRLYFNFGNNGRQIKDREGKPVVDLAGNEIKASRQPYQEGMAFRCELDGSHVETLGWNFRNNWLATVDSFGTLWQSDNDDDGNKAVRINYVMEYGNYGYKDEITGAGWKQKRTGMHAEIPSQHWHLNDPGVVPNLLHTGAGSPTGITIYEGKLLPEVFRGQLIHCDAGPSVVRAYPVRSDGAGYAAETVNILEGTRDKWFRPSDVKVAPDGSLIVADWYDPGVGGHRMGDLDRGRLFRVTPSGHTAGYKPPKYDYTTAAGAVEALKNPSYAVRYVAWQALRSMGERAEPALRQLWRSDDPRHRARALWLLARLDGSGATYVQEALRDADPDIRITGVRVARQLAAIDTIDVVRKLSGDPAPQVRRELALALRHSESPEAPRLWAELAARHDGKDRWYLEALGIGADRQWETFFAAWLQKVGDNWNTPAGRDIVWRSRAKAAPALLAKIVQDPAVPTETHARYMRAFDFHSGPEKDAALRSLLGL